ncbi:MAG: hypothetical protein KatS3mg111_2006 [Pirellulaceae bacterium]|nr:MAG: hypothetical protein KatS3mg111_2006 [Pirellulaceae bacterium]
MQTYKAAERATDDAGTELLEWLGNVTLLGEHLTADLIAKRDAAGSQYGSLLQDAIERNLDFFRRLQPEMNARAFGDEQLSDWFGEPLLGTRPLVEALRWRVTADSMAPMVATVLATSESGRQTPWSKGDILAEAGLRTRWDDGPHVSPLSTQSPSIAISGRPILEVVTPGPGTNEAAQVWIKPGIPAPLTVELSSPSGIEIEQASFSVGSTMEFDEGTGAYEPRIAAADFATSATAGATLGSVDVDFITLFAGVELDRVRVTRVAPPSLTLRGRLGDQPPSTLALGSVKSDQASVVLRVDLSRRGEVVAGAPVSYRLIGAGTLSSGETETDENGVARVVYTPPNATPDMPVDSNGVALVIASYTENGALFSKMLTLVYQPRENSGGSGDATGSGFDTPDQEQAAADLADLIAAHTTTDSLGVQTVDWDAIRGPAKQILSQWWGTPDDYQTLGAGHAVGSVLYWLEAVTHLPPDLQWNENADEQDAVFRQTLQNALGNWAQWFAAAKALEIAPSSVPGFNALAGDERIIAALNTAIARTHDRCVARADEYKAAPSGTEQQREYRVELLRRLVQEGEEALEYYTAGRILEVFKRAPSTLEEIRDALCYIPEISTSRDETFLKPNGTSTTSAKFQMRAGIRVEGVEELLFVEGLTVAVTPVGGSSTDLITGATDADGYFRHTIPMDTREEVIEVDAVVSWNASTIAEQGSFITFAEQRVLLEGAPVMDIRVAKVSDGPGALSTTAPTLVDGEELLVELRLTRGPAPAAHQTVFTAIHGPAAETELFYVTNESGIVRFVVSPNVKQTGDIVIAFAYRDQDGVRSRSIRVPHQSTDDGAATVTAFSAAQTEAEARVGEIVGQAVIDLGPMAEFDFDLNIDPQLLKAPQEYWLNAGLAGPDEPVGLQKRVDELSIDTLETTLTEYARWRAANEFLGVDELFPQGPLEDTLRTKYRQVVEALIQLIWDPDPNRVGEAPSADGARRLLRWAAQAEHMGFDRSDINDESYSFNAILSRLGYELKIDEVLLDGPATNALLTVNANYYLWDADPGAGGTGTGKVQAATMSGHPVVVDVVPFNGMLSEQDGELKRLAPNGHYVNGIRLGPNATELVVDVLASDSEYGTIYDWRRKIKLPAEYRFDGAAKKASENDNAWSKELSVSSHVDTPEQAVIRGELYQGTGRLTGQQVTAELAAPAKGTLQRDGQQGDRFLYTPPPGEDGSQTIQLTTIIAGERQSTEITITYENTPAGTVGQTGDDSLWGWITRQFDSLTTPLGDGDAAGSGVGSSFGMEDIQFPSLGGSFNRAAGYAGGLLDAAIGAFDVVDTISLSEVLDWLQNGPPAETKNLIEFSFDLNAISAILSPTLLAADFTDLLPEGFSGTASVDRPELTGQIVFGLDSSNDSFYIRTRPDRTAKSEPQQRPVTDMGARFGIAAHIDAQLELFDGILTLEHGEGYLTTKVQADWSHVAPADGKLRLSHLDQLQHLQVGFDGNPLDSFQLMLAANAKIPGVSEAGSGATDPSLSLPLAGAVFKPSLDTIAPADRPPEGADLPTVFELRTGTLDLNIDPQLAEALKTQTITVNGQEKDDVHEFLGDYHQLLVGGPGDLGIPNQKLTVVPLALRDAADWFRFEITSRGTPTSYVQVDFARQRGDLDLELYRETVDSATGGRSVVFVRGDALAFGDRARVSLLGQPAGVYYLRVSDDAGGRNPYYSITIQPPKPVDTGVTAEIEGFELRDTGLAFSVDTEFNFDAQLQGRLLIPYSLQEGVPTEIGFQAQVDNQGLHAEVVTEIGADAVLTRREAVPTIGAIEVDVDGQLGGMMIFDYQSPDRFKFAGLENTTEFGKRWVIGQFELVEAGGSSGNVGSSEPRWTVLANGNAEELAGVSGMIRMRVEWNGGQVRVGRQLSTGGFNVQANYQFSSSFAGGLAGLAASTRSAQFQNYRVFAKQAASGTYVELAQDPLTSTPADPWQVERGVWRVENGILTGKPTEVRLGDWLLVSRARLAAELDVRFNQQDILGPPTSVAAEIGVSDLDALLYEVSDGGTPLYPDDPNSPEGLVAIEGGFGTLSTDGLALGAERFSAGIKDVVFLEIYDGKIDLAGGPNLLQAGGVGITVPFFGDEPFQIQDTNPDDDVPLLALKRPEIDAGQIVRDAAFAFGQAVGFDLPVGQGLDEFNLRDLLPLTVENVHLEFPDTNQLDTFKLSVDAQFNLYETDEDGNVVMQDGKPKKRGFFAALPFDPILAIGRPDQQSCSSGTVINWPEIDSNEFPDVQGLTLCENGFVQVEVEASSLLNPDRQLMFTELGPIFIGARNVPIPATSVAADGALYLGKFVNGSWDGDIAGTFTLRDTRPNENNSVRASAVGQISVSEGTTI